MDKTVSNRLIVKKDYKKQLLLYIIIGIFTAFTCCVNLNPTYVANVDIGPISLFFSKLTAALNDKEIVFTLITILTPALFYAIDKYCNSCKIILIHFLSAVLSVLQVFGLSIFYTASLKLIYDGYFQIFKTICMLIGCYIMYYYAIRVLYSLLHREHYEMAKSRWNNFLFEKNPLLIIFFVSILAKLPHMLAKFPVEMEWDTCWELDMYYSSWLNTHHTVLHTLLIDWLSDLGIKLGYQGIGFFIYLIVQLLFSSWVLAYACSVAKRFKTPIWSRHFMLIVMLLTPYILRYTAHVEKDTMYSFNVFLLVIELCICATDWKAFLKSKKDIFITILSSTFTILFRKNGMFVVLITFIVLMIWMLCKRASQNIKKSDFAKAIAIVLVPIVLATGFNNILISVYKMDDSSIREALSVPFMQTARYIAYYDDEVTQEEKDAINAVLDYEKVRKIYLEPTNIGVIYKDNTCCSDLVKNTYKEDSTKLGDYFKVWFKMFLKHPGTYLVATWAVIYPLGCYDMIECNINYTVDTYPTRYMLVRYEPPQWVTNFASSAIDNIHRFMGKAPVINILNDPTTYSILSLIFVVFLINDKKNKDKYRCKFILPFIPSILSIFVCMIGPCIVPRYLFPVTFSLPFIIGMYTANNNDKPTKTDLK